MNNENSYLLLIGFIVFLFFKKLLAVIVDINVPNYKDLKNVSPLLKNLVNVGFDGNIECKAVNKCHHTITIANNVFVQKGNHNTSWCL
jgi:hypothetical protein